MARVDSSSGAKVCSWSSYLNGLFYLAESNNVYDFADDTTFYSCDKDLNTLINKLEHDSYLAIEWFVNNCKPRQMSLTCYRI